MTTPAIPTTKEEAAAVLAQFNAAQTEHEILIAECDAEIEAIKARYTPLLQNAATAEALHLETLQAFADAHPLLFDEASTVALGEHGRIGYQKGKWAVTLAEGVTEDDVIADLKAIIAKGTGSRATVRQATQAALAGMILRTKVELNRKQCIDQSDNAEVLELLGSVGASITQETKFVVKPARKGQSKAGAVTKA